MADNDSGKAFGAGLIVGGGLTFTVMAFAVALIASEGPDLRKQAIEHGYAEYDGKTGQWQWIEQAKD